VIQVVRIEHRGVDHEELVLLLGRHPDGCPGTPAVPRLVQLPVSVGHPQAVAPAVIRAQPFVHDGRTAGARWPAPAHSRRTAQGRRHLTALSRLQALLLPASSATGCPCDQEGNTCGPVEPRPPDATAEPACAGHSTQFNLQPTKP
jgi:hypothetical protein